MASIYYKKDNIKKLDGGLTSKPTVAHKDAPPTLQSPETPQPQKEAKVTIASATSYAPAANTNIKELNDLQQRSQNAQSMVDDVVLKNYLGNLTKMEIAPAQSEDGGNDIILFKINKMVYEKNEYATDKFVSVVSSMTYTTSSIYLIVDGKKDRTDFYLGIKCEDEAREKSSIAGTFKSSLLGQFPGAIIEDYSQIEPGQKYSKQDLLLNRLKEDAACVSACVGIPACRNSKSENTNATFVQGIEKFALAMQGKEYTAVILASNVSGNEIDNLRSSYESIHTGLSALANRQMSYSTNESLANALSRTKGYSDATSHSDTIGTSTSDSVGYTHTNSTQSSTTRTTGTSKENACGKASSFLGKVGSALTMAGGAALVATGVGAPLGGAVITGRLRASTTGAAAGLGAKTISESTSITEGTSTSDSVSRTHTTGTNESKTDGTTHTENFSETDGTTSTVGSSKNFTVTVQDKHIQEIQKRIDKQLERIAMSESTGLWSAGAYFISYGTNRATAETAAAIYRSIMQGEQSGVETSAINTWYNNSDKKGKFKQLVSYVGNLAHPVFEYASNQTDIPLQLEATSLLSSKELALMMGLPRKSVPGLPVVEHISLAKEVVRLDGNTGMQQLRLGSIFDQGVTHQENAVRLNAQSLTQHTFVTGSTGSGKSNTVYYLIDQIKRLPNEPKYLVIEPAKGEYKDVFGNAHVYGTNAKLTPLLKVNPFKFPEGVHVLEHIDRLIEIFNVCWPMEAAMPAVLKEAVLKTYENNGWDLEDSTNRYSNALYPTFADLETELADVINQSAYSEEVKSNYQGALVTRVHSLNNGLLKQLFASDEIGDKALFDENVIVDLSRINSQETKSLLMGILIMRLSEYRANSNITRNSALRHVTILEEAHNILKRCSQEQTMAGSNIAGKSVEMLTNAIAEMRTYGEGFVIVDQSPGAVDISAIRNTNTKIIMRLPEETDRKVAGKAAGMKDEQTDEIAKLPTGVAVVYQNDWEQPVLCKVSKFDEKEIPFSYTPKAAKKSAHNTSAIAEILKLLLKGRTPNKTDIDTGTIETALTTADLSSKNKALIYGALAEYKESGHAELWNDANFGELARLVTALAGGAKAELERRIDNLADFDDLTNALRTMLKKAVPELQEGLVLAASQCLMQDYSLGGDQERRIYSAWHETIQNKNS